MYRGHSVGVVVPAYNEEAHLGEVLETMPAFVDRIYVVDDCSTDGTWDVIQAYATATPGDAGADRDGQDDAAAPDDARGDRDDATDADDGRDAPVEASVADGGTSSNPRVVPIRHAHNQGAGAALRTGYLRARDEGVDLAVAMDADGQMDPGEMSRLLDPLVEDEADYAKGNRLANPGDWAGMPPFRLLGNWLLTVLTKVASGYWRTTDPQNGYTAITSEALHAVEIERMRDDHDYPNDLLVRLNVASMRVADVAMAPVYRDEESSIDYASFVPTTSATLARGFDWRLRKRYLSGGVHPVAACYGAGVLGVASGLVGLARSVLGESPRSRKSSVLALAVGALLVVAAMVLDARENEGLEVERE